MITVPGVIEHIIKRSPYLEEALSSGIINLSSLARQIQPEIQQKLLKEIQIGAIVMGLKRMEKKLSVKQNQIQPLLKNLGDLTVKSNLLEMTFTNSPTLLNQISKLLKKVDKEKGSFFTFTEGVFETTLIINANSENQVKEIFKEEELISHFEHLSAVTINLSQETVQTPGVYNAILKSLAWEGINIIEIISSFTELTIIVDNQSVDRALKTLLDNKG